jgi:signal transduction histidine kinase
MSASEPQTPTPADAARAARSLIQAERATIEIARARQFLIAQTTLLGIAIVAVLGSWAIGMLEPLVLTASLTFCAVMTIVSLAGWWWFGRTQHHQPLVLALLYLDSLLGLLFFYVAGEFETPAVAMMFFIIVMAPIYVGKKHAWRLATVQLVVFGSLLAIRHFDLLTDVLPYGSMLPAEALKNVDFVFDAALSFGIAVFGFAFLAGQASIDIVNSQDQLEREVSSKTHELAAAGEALQRANAELALANVELARANDQLHISHGRLEQFNAAVSHDLKSPLQTLMSRAELVGMSGGLAPERVERLAGEIVDTAERMAMQIDELLKLSRVGDRLGDLEPVALAEAISLATRDLSDRIRTSGAQIEMVQPLPSAMGNGPLLQELFQNLLENAIKYGAADGAHIRVAAAPAPEGRVAVSIEDDGPGVPERERDRIFGLFKRMSTHKKVEGVGAGLAIVRRITEVHGGDIRVESGEALPGARFVVTLAATPAPPATD